MEPKFEAFYVEVEAENAGMARASVQAALDDVGVEGTIKAIAEAEPGLWSGDVEPADAVAPRAAWARTHDLAAHPNVVAVEPMFETEWPIDAKGGLESSFDSSDNPPSDKAWHLEKAGVLGAWDVGLTGENVLIGHPDTGYTKHREIWKDGPTNRVRVALGRDYVDGNDDPFDEQVDGFLKNPGHGTRTAGVIMSSNTSGELKGVAPLASIVPFRVSTSVVLTFSQRRLARAIDAAVRAECRVISISMGGTPSRKLARALRRARDAGVIVVAAAGNEVQVVAWPARYRTTIAAAACNHEYKAWSGSSWGSAVDITAPGHDVWVAGWDDGVEEPVHSSGTSYATAITAGAAALWLQKHGPDVIADTYGPLTLAAFREVLHRSTVQDVVDRHWGFGAGVIDAARLIDEPLPEFTTESVEVDEPGVYDDLASLVEAAERTESAAPDRRRALAEALGVGLESASELDTVAEELRYLLFVDPEARAAAAGALERAPDGVAARPGLLAALPDASPQLAERLGSGGPPAPPADGDGPKPAVTTTDSADGTTIRIALSITIDID